MASPAAFNPVEDYLREVWNVTPIVFENETPSPPDGAQAWVFVEMAGNLYDIASIGAGSPEANLWRESGTLWLHVMTPVWTGTREGRQHAWDLAELFKAQPIPGLRFQAMSVGAGEPVETDGNWARMTLTIDWERDDG